MKCPRCTKRVAVCLLTLLLLQVSQAMCPKKALDKPRRGMVAVKSDEINQLIQSNSKD